MHSRRKNIELKPIRQNARGKIFHFFVRILGFGFGLEYIGFPENAEVGALMEETITGLLVLNGPV